MGMSWFDLCGADSAHSTDGKTAAKERNHCKKLSMLNVCMNISSFNMLLALLITYHLIVCVSVCAQVCL